MTRIAMLSALMLIGAAAGAQPEHARPLFMDSTPLRIRIEAPFRDIAKSRRDREQFDGLLSYADASGNDMQLDVKIRIRGKSRVAACSSPPLRLNFKTKQTEGTLFEGQDKLKLAVLCKSLGRYEDYLAQEFQIYRAYATLTEAAFRVRWVTVEYVETGKRTSTTEEPAFLIEADWAAAERLGAELLDVESIPLDDLDAKATTLLAMFQLIIGNTDYSPRAHPPDDNCCHNVFPMRARSGAIIGIPYDFDQAGLIDAEYALPSERLPIKSVTERRYRGYCAMNDEVAWAVEQLDAHRAEIEAAFDGPPADEVARRRSLDYLNESYEIINDQKRLERQIAVCQGTSE